MFLRKINNKVVIQIQIIKVVIFYSSQVLIISDNKDLIIFPDLLTCQQQLKNKLFLHFPSAFQ